MPDFLLQSIRTLYVTRNDRTIREDEIIEDDPETLKATESKGNGYMDTAETVDMGECACATSLVNTGSGSKSRPLVNLIASRFITRQLVNQTASFHT